MKEIENLCVVAMEECAELQQALSKSMRFGFSNYNPDTPQKSNAMDIPDWLYLAECGMKKAAKQVNKIKSSIYHLL